MATFLQPRANWKSRVSSHWAWIWASSAPPAASSVQPKVRSGCAARSTPRTRTDRTVTAPTSEARQPTVVRLMPVGFSLQAVGPRGEERDEYLSRTNTAMSAVRDSLRPWAEISERTAPKVMLALTTNEGVRLDAQAFGEIASSLDSLLE